LAACLHSARRGHAFRSGLALSVAFFKPHLMMVIPFLALRRQGRTLLGFAAGSAALNAPFLFWMDDWLIALARTRDVNLSYGCLPLSSGTALLRCVLGESPAAGWFIGASIAVVGLVTLALTLQPYPPSSSSYRLQVALVVVFGLLALDNVRVADLVLLLFPVLLLGLGDAVPSGWPRRATLVLLLSAYVLPYATLLASPDRGLGGLPVWYSVPSALLYAALVMALLARRRSLPRNDTAEPKTVPVTGKFG
jgi:hypothetical protein